MLFESRPKNTEFLIKIAHGQSAIEKKSMSVGELEMRDVVYRRFFTEKKVQAGEIGGGKNAKIGAVFFRGDRYIFSRLCSTVCLMVYILFYYYKKNYIKTRVHRAENSPERIRTAVTGSKGRYD